ncbi:MAG: hypothetical protein AAF649_10880 [Verrucomicrobiota bacterium]
MIRLLLFLVFTVVLASCATSSLQVAPGAQLPEPAIRLQKHQVVGQWKSSGALFGVTSIIDYDLLADGTGTLSIHGENLHQIGPDKKYNEEGNFKWGILDGNLLIQFIPDTTLGRYHKDKVFILHPVTILPDKIQLDFIVPTNKERTAFFAKRSTTLRRKLE